MKLAVVFPGQGSQAVGMGRDWAEAYRGAREVFADADATLGFALSELCFEGPEEELRLTANTQPAILAASFAIWSAVGAELPPPAFYAGHSLGEYTALVSARGLGFADALRLVRMRGALMQQAAPVGSGAMAAVIGLDAADVERIAREVSVELAEPLEVANYNSPEQLVVSGAAQAVRAAMPRFDAAGARRVVDLPVSAPFHTSLMAPAAEQLRPHLEDATFKPLQTPVVANLTAAPYPGDSTQYPLILSAQICNSVRWTECVQYMAEHSVTHMLEVGPGKVLRTLAPKIAPEIQAISLEKVDQLEVVQRLLEGVEWI